MEFATEPPDIVFSILNFQEVLNSYSSTSFIVLLVSLFFNKKLSSILHMTSTIAFPTPRTFMSTFFCYKFFFYLGNSFYKFCKLNHNNLCLAIFPSIPNNLQMKFIPILLGKKALNLFQFEQHFYH